MSKIQAIKNPQGIPINTQLFREEALHFLKYGYYTAERWGSAGWVEYWKEQQERCIKGYEVGGVKITGDHYFYLNFSQIEVAKKISDTVARKIKTFPDFWDGDYNYFWSIAIARDGILNCGLPEASVLEAKNHISQIDSKVDGMDAEQAHKCKTIEEAKALKKLLDTLCLSVTIHPDNLGGGYHVIVGKSRRKGYSYKNGAICANIYNHTRNSLTLIGAHDKKFLYPEGTMGMASSFINFINENTGWRKSKDFVDKQDHRKASFESRENGVKIEKGYQSQIMALTFKDRPEAARGKDAALVLFEEAGAFPNLIESYNATKPGLTAGKFITGQMIIFGTGGDMESGTADFAEMFYKPELYGLLPFENIWDEDAEGSSCGFFHPVTWNMEGYYDENGISDIEGATEFEKKRRQTIIDEASDSKAIQQHTQEFPFCPSEAFLTVSTNNFPTVELTNQLNKVRREKTHLTNVQPVELYYEDGKVRAKPDLKKKLEPIYHYKHSSKNLKGAVMIKEYPKLDSVKGLYKIGYDPYSQDEGTSLGAIYVYKGVRRGDYLRNQLVAWYVGRPGEADDMNNASLMLAELYNAEVMHENMVNHVKNFFRHKKKLHRLAAQPDEVISKNIKSSKVARVYGIHMDDKLKDAGEKYINDWLKSVMDYDENGDAILALETIDDIGLLEELLKYNRKGNFDRVMALMMIMFHVQEEDLNKEYTDNMVSSNAQDLLSLELYKKTTTEF